MKLSCTVNGGTIETTIEPQETLLSTLRDRLLLTGTKEGCTEGECGACTVLVDGKPVDSCIYAAAAAEGCAVETIEGLTRDELGRRLQAAFVQAGGVQCGFCTPGFITTLVAVLRQDECPGEDRLRTALAGNICRCTGYSQILDAVAVAVAGGGSR